MTDYEMMFRRRSVRSYDESPLDEDTLREILAMVNAIPQIPGEKADFRIITQKEMAAGPAPYYIAASCKDTNEAYANVGYVLEKADLRLQGQGYGTLWYGMKLPAAAQEGDAIVLGFGRTSVPLRGEDGFHRLPLQKISESDNPITQAVRLAPSAVNSQPWTVVCGDGSVTVKYTGRGLMKRALEKKLNKIDVGIAARFAVTVLEESGMTIRGIAPSTSGREFEIRIDFS